MEQPWGHAVVPVRTAGHMRKADKVMSCYFNTTELWYRACQEWSYGAGTHMFMQLQWRHSHDLHVSDPKPDLNQLIHAFSLDLEFYSQLKNLKGHQALQRSVILQEHWLSTRTCWFGLVGEVLPDEGGLPGGVLAHQQHHGLALEVRGLQRRRVEVMEEVCLLQRQQLLAVERLQPLRHGLVHLSLLVVAAVLLLHPAEHCDAARSRARAQLPVFLGVYACARVGWLTPRALSLAVVAEVVYLRAPPFPVTLRFLRSQSPPARPAGAVHGHCRAQGPGLQVCGSRRRSWIRTASFWPEIICAHPRQLRSRCHPWQSADAATRMFAVNKQTQTGPKHPLQAEPNHENKQNWILLHSGVNARLSRFSELSFGLWAD